MVELVKELFVVFHIEHVQDEVWIKILGFVVFLIFLEFFVCFVPFIVKVELFILVLICEFFRAR